LPELFRAQDVHVERTRTAAIRGLERGACERGDDDDACDRDRPVPADELELRGVRVRVVDERLDFDFVDLLVLLLWLLWLPDFADAGGAASVRARARRTGIVRPQDEANLVDFVLDDSLLEAGVLVICSSSAFRESFVSIGFACRPGPAKYNRDMDAEAIEARFKVTEDRQQRLTRRKG
jgi:hypothetical protein